MRPLNPPPVFELERRCDAVLRFRQELTHEASPAVPWPAFKGSKEPARGGGSALDGREDQMCCHCRGLGVALVEDGGFHPDPGRSGRGMEKRSVRSVQGAADMNSESLLRINSPRGRNADVDW